MALPGNKGWNRYPEKSHGFITILTYSYHFNNHLGEPGHWASLAAVPRGWAGPGMFCSPARKIKSARKITVKLFYHFLFFGDYGYGYCYNYSQFNVYCMIRVWSYIGFAAHCYSFKDERPDGEWQGSFPAARYLSRGPQLSTTCFLSRLGTPIIEGLSWIIIILPIKASFLGTQFWTTPYSNQYIIHVHNIYTIIHYIYIIIYIYINIIIHI